MNTRWISENWDQIWQLTSHHALLGVTPVLLSLLLSV
ncbi:ABC transporter permease, partial [Xanthomonas citri pv. citri]|nr:ABC transporter permease [Xanthomonas citri pv. citri]